MNSSRPIWKGSISFGLVMIPVTLYPSDAHANLPFHLLDKRNHARIRYERVNAETGKTVPWNEIVKGYEYEKENYIIIDEHELEKTAYENSDSIKIENFVDKNSIDSLYFERAYYLSPTKQGEKGYALLKRTLENSKKIGIAKIVIRSRQHLATLIPYKNILLLNLIRFQEEIRPYQDFNIPENDIINFKITKREIEMAEKLIKNMSAKWNPKHYRDENRELLHKWIEKKIKGGKSVSEPKKEKTKAKPAKIIDFMTLLQKSIQEKEKKPSKTAKTPLKKSTKKLYHRTRHDDHQLGGHGKKKKAAKK